jgi:hypothetical protein
LVLQIYEKGFIRKSIRPKKDETFSERRRAFVPVLCCERREAAKRRGSSSGKSGKRSRGSVVWQNRSGRFSCEQGGARRKPESCAEKVGSYFPKMGSKLRNAPRFYIVVPEASDARRALRRKRLHATAQIAQCLAFNPRSIRALRDEQEGQRAACHEEEEEKRTVCSIFYAENGF